MTHIQNLRLTSTLKGLSPHKLLHNELPELSYLRLLGSTVYVLIHKEEQELKSETFVLRALKGKLVRFDNHIIYRVYVEEQKRVIRIKDLQIFKDIKTKKNTTLPDYNGGKPTFQSFLLHDDNDILATNNDGSNIPISGTPKKTKDKQPSIAK